MPAHDELEPLLHDQVAEVRALLCDLGGHTPSWAEGLGGSLLSLFAPVSTPEQARWVGDRRPEQAARAGAGGLLVLGFLGLLLLLWLTLLCAQPSLLTLLAWPAVLLLGAQHLVRLLLRRSRRRRLSQSLEALSAQRLADLDQTLGRLPAPLERLELVDLDLRVGHTLLPAACLVAMTRPPAPLALAAGLPGSQAVGALTDAAQALRYGRDLTLDTRRRELILVPPPPAPHPILSRLPGLALLVLVGAAMTWTFAAG